MGYDAGKKVKGRKVHALVDTEGLPLRVVVHSAAIQDRDGAALVFDCIRQRCDPAWKNGSDSDLMNSRRRLGSDSGWGSEPCMGLTFRSLFRADSSLRAG